MPYRDPKNWVRLRPWTRHSLVLGVAGLVYIGIGIAYFDPNPPPAREAALRVALTWMPIQGWSAVFVAVGLLAMLSSRWPVFSLTWGYVTMTGLSALWSGVYLGGIVIGGSFQGFTGALLFGLLAFMWWAISGLVNPASGHAQ